MRVAIIADWFLKYTVDQAIGLQTSGAEVLVACREGAEEFDNDVAARRATLGVARERGIRIIEIPGRVRDASGWRCVGNVRRALTRFAPDVVHVHDHTDPRLAALTAGFLQVVTVHDVTAHPGHAAGLARWHRWGTSRVRRLVRHQADAFFVHSEALRPAMEARAGARPVYVVPHGLSRVRGSTAPPDVPTLGFFGRLEPYKGLEVLLAAMDRVWAVDPRVRLRIAGSGDLVLSAEDPRVSLRRGYLPELEVRPWLQENTLVVLPYVEASQSGVGSEAVGSGVPVAATRVGGLGDLVLDASYLAAPGDPGDLADVLLRHRFDGRDVRQAVLDRIAEPRTWDRVAGVAIECYADLRGRRLGAAIETSGV